MHGFLGPNGAGKSTTIRVLLGLLRADGGTVTSSGATRGGRSSCTAAGLRARRRLLWPNLTGGEVIDLLGRLRGGVDTGRRDKLLEAFELDPTKKGRSYSKGNRQKVALVAALASDAALLVLDEPTSGLDPLMEKVFQEHLTQVRAEGRTVLLSSHILSEVEEAADRVSIIRAGRIVDSGTLSDLRHLTRTSVTATLTRPVAQTDVGAVARAWTQPGRTASAWSCPSRPAPWARLEAARQPRHRGPPPASRPPWRSCSSRSTARTSRARTPRRCGAARRNGQRRRS